MDVRAVFDRLFDAVERFVRTQFQPVRIVNERIARDPRLCMIRFAEAAVDDNELSLCLDGAFAVLLFDGNVPVDDMAVFSVYAEIAQYLRDESLVVVKAVICVARLFMKFLVVYVQPFESGQFFPGNIRSLA